MLGTVITIARPGRARQPLTKDPPQPALKRQLAWTQQSVRELRDALRELRAAILARQRAEHELRELYRERAIARARAAERDPAARLQRRQGPRTHYTAALGANRKTFARSEPYRF